MVSQILQYTWAFMSLPISIDGHEFSLSGVFIVILLVSLVSIVIGGLFFRR